LDLQLISLMLLSSYLDMLSTLRVFSSQLLVCLQRAGLLGDKSRVKRLSFMLSCQNLLLGPLHFRRGCRHLLGSRRLVLVGKCVCRANNSLSFNLCLRSTQFRLMYRFLGGNRGLNGGTTGFFNRQPGLSYHLRVSRGVGNVELVKRVLNLNRHIYKSLRDRDVHRNGLITRTLG